MICFFRSSCELISACIILHFECFSIQWQSVRIGFHLAKCACDCDSSMFEERIRLYVWARARARALFSTSFCRFFLYSDVRVSSCEHFLKFSQANICPSFVSFNFILVFYNLFIFRLTIKILNSSNMNFNFFFLGLACSLFPSARLPTAGGERELSAISISVCLVFRTCYVLSTCMIHDIRCRRKKKEREKKQQSLNRLYCYCTPLRIAASIICSFSYYWLCAWNRDI